MVTLTVLLVVGGCIGAGWLLQRDVERRLEANRERARLEAQRAELQALLAQLDWESVVDTMKRFTESIAPALQHAFEQIVEVMHAFGEGSTRLAEQLRDDESEDPGDLPT